MNVIKINNCIFSYKKNSPVLNIKNLEVHKGESLFIYGPSGHGKSTLLNLISGILDNQSGSLEILGHNLKDLSPRKRDQLRGEKIGYIFQIFNLINYLSVFENVKLPCLINKKRSDLNHLDSEIHALLKTLRLEEHMHKKVHELSIGQQQRVACARALIGNPEIIIADEPTSALDQKNTEDFMDLLFEMQSKKNFTLLFVSHDERLKKRFSRSLNLTEINAI